MPADFNFKKMTSDNSKISFIIPAYNCADTIVESIDSIFNGNFEDGDEVIIVNDASTDKTWQIINDLQKNTQLLKRCRTISIKGRRRREEIPEWIVQKMTLFFAWIPTTFWRQTQYLF